MRVRRLLQAVAATLLCTALAWGLLRFGATETWSLYGLFLALVVAALVALPALRLEALDGWRWVAVVLVGIWILAQAAFRPTLAAEGFVHLGVGWLALALTLWLGSAGRRSPRWIFLFLVLVGFAEAAFALLELRGTVSAIARNPEIQRHLAVGTLINPNHFAGLVNMTLALACGGFAVLLGRAPGRRSSVLRFAGAALLLAASGMMALASHRAESHGGMLALIAALVWMSLLAAFRRWRSLRRRPLSRGGIIGAAIVVGLLALAGIGVAIPRSGILSLQHRAEVYRETLTLIHDRPLLGVGPWMYQWRFRPYQTFNVEGLYVHAHNDYLQTAAEWGIPAALAFWAFVAWCLHRTARRFLVSADPWLGGIALGCSGAIAVILVHSLVDFNLQIPGNWMVFSMIVGLAWSLEASPEGQSGRRPSRRFESTRRVLVWLGLPLLLVAAGVAAGRQLAAIQLARKVPGVPGLEAAIEIDPRNPELRFRLALPYRDDLAQQDLAGARRHLEAAVRLNPYAWTYRLELAKLYELLGLEDEAARAYREAVALNPGSSAYHWRAANFLLRSGDLEGSLPSFRAALADSGSMRGIALDLLLAGGASLSQIEQTWPSDRAGRLDLLKRLARQDELGRTFVTSRDLLQAWGRLQLGAQPPTLAEAEPFLQYLLDRGLHEEARRIWVDSAAVEDLVDEPFAAKRNYLWNGGFELPLSDGLLAWKRQGPKRNALVSAVRKGPRGSKTLGVDLTDTSKVNSFRLQQLVIVDPAAAYEVSLVAGATVAWEKAVETTLKVQGRRDRRRLVEAKVPAGAAGGARFSYGLEVPADIFLIDVVIEARSRRGGASAAGASWWLDSVVLERTGLEASP